MAENYAKAYSLISFAGSDNHVCGMQTVERIVNEAFFVERVKEGSIVPFYFEI